MTDLIKDLQKVNLNMASYFVDFCKDNDLLCYFCGGGCIGTVRHSGFIPWDDDLDFFMPREDYNKLYDLWISKADTEKYSIVKQSYEIVDHNIFITIRDNETTFLKPYQKGLDIPHGVPLDIIPLDGCPNSRLKRKIQKMWANIYSLYCAQFVPENHGKIVAIGSKLLLTCVPGRYLKTKVWQFAEKQMTKYSIEENQLITELCSGVGYMQNEFPKEIFSKAIMKPFEDRMMPIPIGYDKYLKIVFGDYMELPAIEDQKPHHEFEVFDSEKSYKDIL